jgi:hypothetical protein
VLVGVDESPHGDPFLAPSTQGIAVTPGPGIVPQIELPILPRGEVEGLLLSSSTAAQPSAALELVKHRGAAAAEPASEYGGLFLLERDPYGDYSMSAQEDAARECGANVQCRGAALFVR